MMRQFGKQILTLAVLFVALISTAIGQKLITTTVTDPLTGVAMDGYDPVTYFVEEAPQRGSPDFVYEWSGVPWYFVSAANRDVFMRAPSVYAPQHGGYCEMSLARGFLSDGKPQFFAIRKAKLYLFYSAANREAFLISGEETVAAAEKNWPDLAKRLIGPASEIAASSP